MKIFFYIYLNYFLKVGEFLALSKEKFHLREDTKNGPNSKVLDFLALFLPKKMSIWTLKAPQNNN